MANILPYEVTLWEDYHDSANQLKERRIGVIGSSEYKSPIHIFEPNLVTKVNGTTEFTFKICYKYRDELTGELKDNPWCDYLINERKIKAHYNDEWYDLLLKNWTKTTGQYTYECTASDANVQELARNGFNLEFSSELENGYGTVNKLGNDILQSTDWTIDTEASDNIYQYENEVLYGVSLNDAVGITWYSIQKGEKGRFIEQAHTGQPSQNVRIFDSSRHTTNGIVSFLYNVPATITIDDVNSQQVVKTSLVQQGYYFGNTSDMFSEPADGWKAIKLVDRDKTTTIGIVRGERYVHTQREEYVPVLNKWVRLYKDGATEYRQYTDTTYLTPAAVREYVSNGYNFTNTSGWRAASYTATDEAVDALKLNNTSVQLVGDTQLYESFTQSGESWPASPTPSTIQANRSNAASTNYDFILLNLGIQSQIKQMGAVTQNDEFFIGIVSDMEYDDYTLSLTTAEYDTIHNIYKRLDGSKPYFNIMAYSGAEPVVPDSGEDLSIQWFIAKPNANYSESDLTDLGDNYKWILAIADNTNTRATLSVRAMYMFKKQIANNILISPYNWSASLDHIIQTNEYWYIKDDNNDATTPEEWKYCDRPLNPTPYYYENCAKIRSITAKESNRFNLLQEICEQFQCWMEFNVGHDENGAITSKKVSFHNIIGEPNYAGFRYGINEKSIKRNSDSKQLVSKLIVKQNSNEFGKNGFCTIARAQVNPTLDTAIYNFDYYLTHGLVNQEKLYDSLTAYYNSLRDYNENLAKYSDQKIELEFALNEAESKRQIYEAALSGLEVNVDENAKSLHEATGYNYEDFKWGSGPFPLTAGGSDIRTLIHDSYNDIAWELVSDYEIKYEDTPITTESTYYNLPFILYLFNSNVRKYVTKLYEYEKVQETYTDLYRDIQSHIDNIKNKLTALNTLIQTTNSDKAALNLNFYTHWAPFIQEGTFIDESYRNDDQYYYAAQQAGFESAMPKASYTIEVASIGAIPEFEGYQFKLGDQTTIEDVDFFGYMPDGFTPYRESITITEVQNNLDDPSKDKIVVKNFSDQFEQLFKRMAATVQQVQYSTGAYERAAALAEADVPNKLQFLSDALNSAQNVLSNAADQTVKWDNTGITVTNGLAPNEILRMVSGAILLSDDGGVNWTTAITARGISANLITSGQINTNVLQIMNGTQPTFRWDEKGLTAYDVLNNNQVDYTAGVRFDKNGIYGFEGAQPDWAPTEPNEIHKHSNFELTKEGLSFSTVSGSTRTTIESEELILEQKGLYFYLNKSYFTLINLPSGSRKLLKYIIPANTQFEISYTSLSARDYYIVCTTDELKSTDMDTTHKYFTVKNGSIKVTQSSSGRTIKIIDVDYEKPCYVYVYQAVNGSAVDPGQIVISTTQQKQVFNYFYPNGKQDIVNGLNEKWVLNINGKTGISKNGTLSAANANISGIIEATDNNGRNINLLKDEYPFSIYNNDTLIAGYTNNGSVLFNSQHSLAVQNLNNILQSSGTLREGKLYDVVINDEEASGNTAVFTLPDWTTSLSDLWNNSDPPRAETAQLEYDATGDYNDLDSVSFSVITKYYNDDYDLELPLSLTLITGSTSSTSNVTTTVEFKFELTSDALNRFKVKYANIVTEQNIGSFQPLEVYSNLTSYTSSDIIAGQFNAYKSSQGTIPSPFNHNLYYTLATNNSYELPIFGSQKQATDTDSETTASTASSGGFILQPGQSFKIASTTGKYWALSCDSNGNLSISQNL